MSPKITLIGARGRMGRALQAAASDMGLNVVAGLDAGDDLANGIENADVVVDFSSHQATGEVVRHAVAFRKPLVIGTTGHSAEEKAHLVATAAPLPLVWSGNYSVGVNLLFALTQEATRVLDADYDVEVIEMHHRFKKDAPSGTASRLLEIILAGRSLDAGALRHGRQGITGERTRGEVGIHALRGGDVVGDHTVLFAGMGERLELTHKASDRGIFARGALRAAVWVLDRPAGLYDMQDVLGLR